MRIAVTDQFLLDVYNVLEGLGDVAHFFLRRKRTMWDVSPDLDDPRIKRYFKEFSRNQFRNLIYKLKKNNLIKVKSLNGRPAIMLTPHGINKALKAGFKIGSLEKKEKRKDGKWIMIIFDIPKQDERKRGILRSILQNLGYKMFQKSVWVTPYNVSVKTEGLLQFYDLERYVRIFLIEEIE